MEIFEYIPGSVPLIISMPHTGTDVPASILNRFTDKAKRLPDTDWHIARLYEFAGVLGAHRIIPRYSRYVIDLNRPPDDTSLYPGKFTTGLCPATLFDGSPVYVDGGPDEAEIKARTEIYWRPYHDKLESLVNELKHKHGKVAVFDAHSIRSEMPTLFDGVLPDLNIGTADDATCDKKLTQELLLCGQQSGYSCVANGRFKGGYITRHYGNPDEGVHAVQLELAQKNYMQENYPFTYDEARAKQLQSALCQILEKITGFIS